MIRKLIIALTLILPSFFAMAEPAPTTTIAITQFLAHASLDKVHQGIVDALAKQGFQEGKSTHILFANAQGNAALAAQIAHQFMSQHPTVMVAIATPSAQSAASAIQNTNIPLVFATISDPIQAKLVNNLSHPGGMITGTRNTPPIKDILTLIKQLQPTTKTLGIVFNPGEQNSIDILNKLKTATEPFNIIIKTAPALSSAEVKSASMSLVGKADAFLLLQDNTVASAVPALLAVAQHNKMAVYSLYLDAVKQGALASLAPDEYAIGIQTGNMVVKILKGQKAGNLAVEDPKTNELALNLISAKQLGITFDKQLIKKASFTSDKP